MLTPCLAALALTIPATAPQERALSTATPFLAVLQSNGQPHEELLGVWQVRGYGWMTEVHPTRSRVYDHSPAGTLLQENELAEYFVGSHYRMLSSDIMQLTGRPGSSTVYTWDRLPALPASVATPPGTDPVSVFDYFWDLMDHHYAYFELRGVDWGERREEHRGRVSAETSEAELYQVLCDMLTGFHDDHMSLQAEVDGSRRTFSEDLCRHLDPALEQAYEQNPGPTVTLGQFRARWFQRYRDQVRQEILEGEAQTHGDAPVVWGRIGLVGYLNITAMAGYSDSLDTSDEVAATHEVMDRALTDLADCEGIVLDITLNSGGYDEVQMAISSHFTDQRRVAFYKEPLDTLPGAPVERQPFHLFPAEGKRYLGPVTLLTSDFTVSAGEDFTLAMRELPHVTHRGTQTRGAFSDVLTKPLPNGWQLNLSNEAYLDVNGKNWEALGVPPEEEIPVFVAGSLETSHVDAVFTVVDKMMAGE